MAATIFGDSCADLRSPNYTNFGLSILLLFLLFFPHATPLTAPNKPGSRPSYRTAIVVFVICILHAALIFIISLIVVYLHHASVRPWAHFLGVFGTLLAAVQFLPQIWTTWKLQQVGSLSIPMMCIQTPGSFVWVGSLAARLGWGGWSTWGIYLVTGVLQGCLLIMCVGFEVRDWKRRKHDLKNGGIVTLENENEADERTRLVGNESG
ncbi:MAG: hypothetical protein Q9217_002404 [Psora testacea]